MNILKKISNWMSGESRKTGKIENRRMSELTEQDVSEIHNGIPKIRIANDSNDGAYNNLGCTYDKIVYEERDRSINYDNYEYLDETSPEASTAIDAIRDNVAYDKFLNTFTFSAADKDDKKLQAAVTELNKIVSEYAAIFSRQMPKMGDSFFSIVKANIKNDKWDRTQRVKRLLNLPPNRVIRYEDDYGDLKDFYFVNDIRNYQNEKGVLTDDTAKKLDIDKVLHFRIRNEYMKYGRSILFSSISATKK